MSRFGDLLKTGAVHSAFEEENSSVVTESVPEPVAPPPVVEPEPTPITQAFVNPLDEMPVANGDSIPNFKKMSKFELEEYGRTVGIELDKRLSQKKLVKQLKEHIGR